jgi:uncharacterized membrane protein
VNQRIDFTLESRGSIFSGRDEKDILQKKREREQQEMRVALDCQINEKLKRKQNEKHRELEDFRKDEARIRKDLEEISDARLSNTKGDTPSKIVSSPSTKVETDDFFPS